MAEYGAFLAGHVSQKPSVFEVLAQENLSKALRNAAAHLLSYFAGSGDRSSKFLRTHVDELVTLADFAVQLYHLREYGSSFSEHFYGLRRVTAKDDPLERSHVIRSLAALVLLPYARKKLDAVLEQADPNSDSGLRTLRRLYPAIRMGLEALSLSSSLLYALGKSPVHSVALSLASVRLAVAPPSPNADLGDTSGFSAAKLFRGLADAASATLATAAFLLHFLDWWNAQNRGDLAPSPPVPAPPLQDNNVEGSPKPDQCPICRGSIVADRSAVLSCSGYVFCLECIRTHLQRSQSCPVTGYPATVKHIVPLLGQ